MKRDLKNAVNAAYAIPPATYAADTTPTSVDLQGYQSAALLLQVGIGGITFTGTNKIEFVLTHSDDDSTYTNVTDSDVVGVSGISNGIIKALTAAQAAATIDRIGYVGSKRYLKVLADFSGTHGTGTPIAVTVLRGDPKTLPAV